LTFLVTQIGCGLAGYSLEDIVSSENHTYLGETMTFKVYLGNLLVNTMEDGHFAMADEVWIKDDSA